jgi:hypothetical protein
MDDKIILSLKPNAFHFLGQTLDSHKNLIQITQMNSLIKKELIDDISKIKITIDNAKKGE